MKVLNYGSLNIDYVYAVDSFVKEGETKSSLSYSIYPGGKGLNQSIALRRAGFEVFHAGKIGKEGKFLADLLIADKVDVSKLLISPAENGHAIIQVDPKGSNCILLHGGTNMQISRSDIDDTLKGFAKGDLLVLQNEISNIDYIIDKAHSIGMVIAINIAPVNGLEKNYDLKKVNIISVNETEGKAISGKSDYDEIIEWFGATYPAVCTVLTLGGDGSMCYYGGNIHKQGIIKVDIKDTTSAGDTFFGFFIKKFVESYNVPQALELAAKASAICVSRNGAAQSIPFLAEIR